MIIGLLWLLSFHTKSSYNQPGQTLWYLIYNTFVLPILVINETYQSHAIEA